MTAFPAASKGSRELVSSIRFQDFDVSWAGASVRKDLFCFGSEDGRFLLADADGVVKDEPQEWAPSKEAINGVAFIEGSASVSTRNEVMLWTQDPEDKERQLAARIPVGAHGVIAGHCGYFFAPLGLGGLLACRAGDAKPLAVIMKSQTMEERYFYRVISLPASDGREVVVCATRKGGLASMEFTGETQQNTLNTLTFSGVDVVDVCALNVTAAPMGVAALGKDGTVVLSRDVLRDDCPRTVKYEPVRGTAYRILSARGYIFLLTSEGLYVSSGFIDRFLSGGALTSVTPGLALAMEAVDANLGSDQWLWIVMPDGVLRFDVELLDRITASTQGNGGPKGDGSISAAPVWHPQEVRQISPAWERRELQQSSKPVLAAV
jgi:hypothetical protein